MSAPLVELDRLGRSFDVSAPWMVRMVERRPRRVLKAVDDVTLTVPERRTLGLVGESGCGKSTLARCVAGLLSPSAGTIRFRGRAIDLARKGDVEARRAIQMVFQDPYASLNPRWSVGQTLSDPLVSFGLASGRAELEARVAELLVSVGLSPEDRTRYPHEFSGGQRQRIAIARALASRPAFLICDEPTSALDVSVQAHILNLMRDLQEAHGLTFLFISHNLAVVDHMADEVGVMYLGRLIERQEKRRIFAAPRHPYTRLLIEAAPSLKTLGRASAPLAGETPSPLNPPSGCAFHPRCPHADARCRAERPEPLAVDGGGTVACHRVEEGRL
jgi:peptide/nickel transport system ATP-binding protein